MAVHLFDGPDPNDRAVLIGTQDGWILKHDPDAYSDDSYPIESYAFIGPIQDMMLSELQGTLGILSGNVQWTIHTDDDLETALTSEPVASGEFVSGRNRSQWPRHHVRQGWLKLASTSPWSLEKILAGVEQDSELRSRIY